MDCIYEGGRALYIHPDECVDCGACEPVCPVEAIYYEDDLPAELKPHLADNEAFFAETLPGRDAPLGSPGGAAKMGPLGRRHAVGGSSAEGRPSGRSVRVP